MTTACARVIVTICIWLLFSVSCIHTHLSVVAEELVNNCIDDNDECQEQSMHPNMHDAQWRRVKSPKEKTNEYWLQSGVRHVKQKLQTLTQPQRGRAKNIIFFIGDGMSLATLAATRIYLGGEEQSLSFEKFPYTGLTRTYALDRLVPDSAAAATALLCGVKTNYGLIGFDGNVKRGTCDTPANKSQLTSIADWALNEGKSVGLVTTTRVTDATPAALYAHVSERSWENDVELSKKCGSSGKPHLKDIGLQLMEGPIGKRLKVVMGGGRAQLIDRKLTAVGKRKDGRDLIAEFSAKADNIFVNSKANLTTLKLQPNGRLLALFNDDHLAYHADRQSSMQGIQPSLSEMTAKAIDLLSDNAAGYLLLVEAGKIDLAHHENKAKLALDETAELSKAVAKAYEMTMREDTLIVVTADHGHTMTLAGYAHRSGDIFGNSFAKSEGDLPYKILSYANGPSYFHFHGMTGSKHNRPEAVRTQPTDFDVFPATVPLRAATHGGEDVPVFATGPWAHLFSGIYDQSTIPHLMAYAGCLDKQRDGNGGPPHHCAA